MQNVPGLVDETVDSNVLELETVVDDLPGFPSIVVGPTKPQNKYLEQAKDKKFRKNEEKASSISDVKTETKTVYNKKFVKKIKSDDVIKRVIATVVVDQSIFDLLNLNQEYMEQLLFSVSGLDKERGDQFGFCKSLYRKSRLL